MGDHNDNMAVHAQKPSSMDGVATTPDFTVKAGLAQMLKGGVIMDVVNAEQVSPTSLYFWKACIRLLTSCFKGPNSRRIGSLRRHGPRACPCRYPPRWWCCPHV